ncbi:MAG TPA: tetratricopeptide repeat protein [Methylomirabilota bacterium]|nr:tetratricopeptide repeat protein [Methylomirabilota bacterium]
MTGAGRGRLLLPVLIFIATAAPFLPALEGEFLNWDDSVNLAANPHYRGLGWTQIQWMFTTTLMGHYIPLTWLSFGLNYALGGTRPWGYHLVNIGLHAANATLVYLIGRRLLAAAGSGGSAQSRSATPVVLASASAALLWGVHPLRVESVAWITERRDVLCGLFFLLAVLAYLRGQDPSGTLRPTWQGVSLVAFFASLLSKAAAMPLPAVLVLLDVYPLRRRALGWTRLLVEKLPYAVLAVATAAAALIALPRGTQVTSYETYGPAARLGMVVYSFLFYPLTFAVPIRLSPMYELPARVELGRWPFLAALLGFIALTAVLVLARARWPAGLAAWCYSALMVLPISGVVHAGSQLVNDRYSYLSGIGFAMLGGGVILWGLRMRGGRRISTVTGTVLAGGAALLLGVLAVATWSQAHVWRDSETLWRWAVEVDPACSLCHANLGSAIMATELGLARLDESERHLRRAIELRPDNPTPYYNLGTVLAVRRRWEEAEAALGKYRELVPASTSGMSRLGLLYLLRGRYDEAIPLLEGARGLPPTAPRPDGSARPLPRAISLVEDDLGALTLLGRALVEEGRPQEATLALERAVALAPSNVPARFWLIRAYQRGGRDDLAQAELVELRRLDPRAAEAAAVR